MSSKTVFSIAGVVLLIWAVLGFMDVANFTYTGYGTGPDNEVVSVAEGGPAEAAGMEVGDRVVSMDGVSIEDTRGLSSLPRPAIGQTQVIVVERDGQTVDLSVTHEARSSSSRLNSYVGILMGLVFLGMGLWAFFAAPGPQTKLLAMFGIFFAMPFTGGPYLGSSTLSTVVLGLIFVAFLLAIAKLLHFMIVFPDGAEPDKRWVYGPALLVGVVFLGLQILQPNATSGLNRVVQFIFLGCIFGYLGLALFKLTRTWTRAGAADRDRHGLNLLFVGTGLGLGILLVSALIGVLLPSVTIPGAQWLSLSLALVPISCALAAVRSARSGAAAPVAVEVAPDDAGGSSDGS